MKEKIRKENQKIKEKMKEKLEKMKNKETDKKEKKITKAKIKLIANRFFNSIGFPILIGILLFLKTLFFYENTISIRETIDKDTVLGTIAFLTTMICVICALPNRGRTITTIVVDILLSIILFADNVYHTYSSSVLSVAQMMNLQYGEEIMDTLPMLIQAKEILYFLDFLLIIVLLCAKALKIHKRAKTKWRTKIAKVLVGMIAIALFFKIDVDFIEKTKEDPFNKDMQVKKSTIYGYHISDIENTINIKKQAKYTSKEVLLTDYEKLKEEYDENYGKTNYDIQGIAKEKNVIILQLESIQNFVINKEINGKEITPIEISNMFMQSYSSTADSEFSTVTSLYPMENGMSYSRYYTNTYDDIFTMFDNEGYTTSYMHGNYGFFWNRENVYKTFGVENIELKDAFADTSFCRYIRKYHGIFIR